MSALRRSSTCDISEAFRDLIGTPDEPTVGGVLGVEHEFTVKNCGQTVGFGHRIHELGLGLRHLDPVDPNAYPLDSGSVLTCDGDEAEIALAPHDVRAGTALEVTRVSDRERNRLAAALESGFSIEGYSTHLSAWTPHIHTAQVARIITCRFAPALMLLFDRSCSPGLLVRPRIQRTEMCGEHLRGESLTAACVAAIAIVRASVELVDSPDARRSAPPILGMKVRGTPDRFGWYVDRCAFGRDLYKEGRDSLLIDNEGRTLTAQQHLEWVWSFARPTVTCSFSSEELAAVDGRVRGTIPLPLEDETEPGVEACGSKARSRGQGDGVGGGALRGLSSLSRPGVDIAPVMVTWDARVFLIADPMRERLAFVTIPHRSLDRFWQLLRSGRLDRVLRAYLKAKTASRLLERREQLGEAGLFDVLPSRRALVCPEMDPEPCGIFMPL